MPLLFSLPLSFLRFSFGGVKRWIAPPPPPDTERVGGRQRHDDPDVGMKRWIAGWRPCLVPLLLLALVAVAPEAAAQTPTLSIDSPSVTEGNSGSTNLTFTVTLSAVSSQQVTVDYADATTGTATSGTDYTAITGGTLTFTAGTTSLTQTFNVSVTGDTTDEVNETVVVTLSSATNATIATGTGTGTITDDDGPAVSINSPSVTEGDSGSTNLTFTATLSAASAQQVTVAYADATTGTATSGTDYTAITAGTLTFTAGTTSQTFNVAVTGDTTDEANETVIVTLSSPTNATIATGTGTGTITNDDGPTLSIDSPSVTEGDSGSTNLTFTVTLSVASSQQVTVDYADATTGTATSGTDYTAITDGTLTFTAGTTSQTFNVSVTGDTTDEVDETVVVTLSSATNATISTATGTGTITDDDVTPGARWTPGGLWTHDVTTTSLIGKLTLQQSVTITGGSRQWANAAIDACPWTRVTPPLPSTACQLLKDYRANGFPNFQDLRLTNFIPTQAMIDNGGVVIRLRWLNYNSPAGNNVGMVEWVPLLTPPSATLVLTPPSISENGGVATVSATLDRQWSDAVTITVSAAAGTGADASDFTLSSANTLTIAAGETTSTGTVTLTAVDNAIDAVDKAVTVSGTASDSVTNAPPDVTLTITDDDLPTLSIDSPSVTEGNSGSKDLTFTVSLSGALTESVTVDYADSRSGTATSGTDYAAITGGTLIFPAGTASQEVTVSVRGDTTVEANETVVLSLSNPANAMIGTGTGTGTIRNDDVGEPPPIDDAPSLSIDSPSVAEGDDDSVSLTFTVTLSPVSSVPVTVDYVVTGTARSGTDFAALTGGTLTFPAGTMSRTITVSVMGDVLDEDDETIVVTLINVRNAAIDTATGTGTITDDDTGPSLAIDSPSVAEGDAGSTDLTFTVTLSEALTEPVTVDYADAGTGTATSGTDYVAITGGTLTFPAGTTSRAIVVAVTGDVLDEPDETVAVTLSNAANAAIGPATGTGTIIDDDDAGDAPTLSIDSPSVTEGDAGSTNLTFTVSLSAASTEQVTVAYADAGTGTATPGTDYAALIGGTLTFPAGTTSQTFNVAVTGDVLDEPDETVVVTLSNATNATISTATGTGAIADDDEPPALSIDSPSVTEGDAGSVNLTWTVTLDAASGRVVTVAWADTGTGTATSGTDYVAITGGALTFPAGTTTQTFNVAVTGDTTTEPDETVVVALSNARNATIGTATGGGTIIDDDLTPSFGSATVPAQSWTRNWPIPVLTLPAAMGGDGALTYALTPELPSGLSFDAAARELSGTPTTMLAATEYSLMATDEDGDTVALSFTIEVTGPITISIADGQAVEGEPVEFGITLSRPVPEAGTLLVVYRITDGTALAQSDYAPPAGQQGEFTIATGQDAATIVIRTTDDDLVEDEETFTVTLVGTSHAELGDAEATGRIIDNDLASLRGEALQWSLAAFGRTVATEAVDAIGQRFRPGGTPRAPRAGLPGTSLRDGIGAASARWTTHAGGTAALSQAGSGTVGMGRPTGAVGGPAGAAWTTGAANDAADADWTTGAVSGMADADWTTGAVSGMADADWTTGASNDAADADWTTGAGNGAVSGVADADWANGAVSGVAGADWANGAVSGVAGAGWTTGAWRNFSLGGPGGAALPGGFSGPERSPQGEFLSQVAFETRLDATDEDGVDGGSGQEWTVWGRGSRSQFSGQSGARITLDGEVNTGYLGADVRLAEHDLLLGVALSHSVGELDYQAAAAGLNEGQIDLDLSSVLPYAHWQLNERVSLWGLLGIGWGEATLTDEFGRVTTDTEMRMAALGSRGELATWRGLDLALKGDAFIVNMEGSEWEQSDAVAMPEVDADAHRVRLMLEGRRAWQAGPQQQLELSLEFGGRWDGGDADTGVGAELGGGLAYRHAAWGLGIETRGRYLLGHTERAFEEWGASVSVALDPGVEGIGPSLTLSPTWGEASSGVENLWREERLLGASLGSQPSPDERGGLRPNRLRMELGYGFETRAQRLLKLYSALDEAGPGSRNWRLGGLVTGRWFTWGLELDRREIWDASPEHGIFLRFGNGLTNTRSLK